MRRLNQHPRELLVVGTLWVSGCVDWTDFNPANVALMAASTDIVAPIETGIGIPTSVAFHVENAGLRTATITGVSGRVLDNSDEPLIVDDMPLITLTSTDEIPAGSQVDITVVWSPMGADTGTLEVDLAFSEKVVPAILSIAVPVAVSADFDGDGDPHVDAGGDDCDDSDPHVSSNATETWYDGVDQDCDGNDDDQDLDGFSLAEDCDDTAPSVFPGAEEVWYDGVDQDCDGNDDDQDQDGTPSVDAGGADCDDLDADVRPGVADGGAIGVDDDCDGLYDEDDIQSGVVVITEMLRQPSDTQAAWFEVQNISDTSWVLDGWTLRTDASSATLSSTADRFVLAPGAFGVICGPSTPSTVPCALTATPWPDLSSSADRVELRADSLSLDTVRWNAAWPGQGGATMSLDPSATDATTNDEMERWCDGTTPAGTPGAGNPFCF